MKRLFFALWPDDETREKINTLNQSIDEGGRKLAAENLHITLVFLGNVDDDIAAAVQSEAAEIQGSPITLQFDELTYWHRPRVLCLTCRRQPKNIYMLVNALTNMVSRHLGELEKRHYRAHITLVRKARRRPRINFEPIRVHADSFALLESVSTEQGVQYNVLETWPLQG